MKANILIVPQESIVPDATKVERIRSKLTEFLKGALASVVEATKKTNSKSAIVTPESPTLDDRAVEGLTHQEFGDVELNGQQQVIVKQNFLIKKLTEKSNRDDAIINRIDNKTTAIEVLEMLKQGLSRKALLTGCYEATK
jgi:hypothetical protein